MKFINPGLKNRNCLFLFSILAIGILYHLSILPPVETGQDAVRKWLMMKTLLWSDVVSGYWAWDHHSSRWAINIPILFFRSIFDHTVNAYYFSAWSAMLATLYFMFKFCLKYMSPARAVVSCLLFIFFEQYSRNANQLIPAIFSNAYIMASFYYLDNYLDTKKKLALGGSILCLFFAYLSKIDNLYFMPAFLYYIFVKERSLKTIIVYSLSLAALYLSETALYALFTDYNFGRLQIIFKAHVDVGIKANKMVGISFFQIFDKILSVGSPLVYLIIFSFIYSPFLFIKKRTHTEILKILGVIIISYYFLKLFILKDYSPFIPLERNKERYMLAASPFLIIFFVQVVFSEFKKYFLKINSKFIPYALGGLICLLFAQNIVLLANGNHRLQVNNKIQTVLNQAYEANIPIVSKHRKDLHNAYRFYLDKQYIIQNNVYVHDDNEMPSFLNNAKKYYYLVKDANRLDLEKVLSQCHILISKKYYKFEVKNCPANF